MAAARRGPVWGAADPACLMRSTHELLQPCADLRLPPPQSRWPATTTWSWSPRARGGTPLGAGLRPQPRRRLRRPAHDRVGVSLLTIGSALHDMSIIVARGWLGHCRRSPLPASPARWPACSSACPHCGLRTFYFAMTTLGFATVLTQMALAWTDVTCSGGDRHRRPVAAGPARQPDGLLPVLPRPCRAALHLDDAQHRREPFRPRASSGCATPK